MNIVDLAILKKMVAGGGGSGTDNYNDLSNLPQINGETLAGNKTAANLGLQDALTFDSAPTEDSTNPVESGGVYNALAGKQDNLTFDDDPTENSTNPVKSGGVYSALAGKQDNLTFDGVYNASTNKAATESTVTNAIAGLDVSDLSVDADETISSISETDGKINVTKQDIAIVSNQVTAMTGYTKPSSAPATPAIQTSDTANQAFGKLEFKADTNQSNISLVQSATEELVDKGAKNVLHFESLKRTNVNYGRSIVTNGVRFTINGDNTITVNRETASNEEAYIELCISGYYAFFADQYCDGEHYLSGCPSGGSDSTYRLYAAKSTYAKYDTGDGVLLTSTSITEISIVISVYNGYNAQNLVFKPMITTKSQFDISSAYQPYALPNYDLTRLEAEDRASLAEVVDSGAKNLVDWRNTVSFQNITIDNGTYTTSGDTATTLRFQVAAIDSNGGQIMAFNGNGTVPTANGVINIPFTVPSGTAKIRAGHNGSTYNGRFDIPLSGTTLEVGKSYVLQVNVTQYTNSSGIFKWKDLMVCTKAAFGVSQKFVPYRPPLSDNTWVKSADLFPSHRTEFDVSNSHVYTYTNKFLNKVVVEIELKAATAISSVTGVLSIASNIANIPPKPVFYDINDITNNFECVILKNNANGSLAFKVTTGTISSGTAFSMQIEYTYGLN